MLVLQKRAGYSRVLKFNNRVFMRQLLSNVVALCQQAGQAILEIYQDDGDFEVQAKADDSPLTRADLAAHQILDRGLQQLLPGVPVLSEEGGIPDYSVRRSWSRYWLVDPLDGTKEFIRRNGEFTVNVALIESGQPILGVVYVPVSGVAYTGLKGVGASKIESGKSQAVEARRFDSGERALTVVASRRHGNDRADALLKNLEQSMGRVETRNMGSSLKLCLIAEGAADFYPRLAPTCEWDTAAAQAVVEAAGGAVLDDQLQPLIYNRKDSLLNPDFFVVGDPGVDWRSVIAL